MSINKKIVAAKAINGALFLALELNNLFRKDISRKYKN